MPSGKIDRRQLLTGGTALTLAGLAGATRVPAAEVRYDLPRSGKAALYSRAELEAFIDRYLAALVAHDPKLAPFASDVIFAENDVRLPLGSASWKTIERLGRYRHYFADPQNGDAGLIATVYENGKGAILVLRLKIRDRQIVEAEQCVTRDAGGAETYEKLGAPDPVWLEAIPEAQRQSHDDLCSVTTARGSIRSATTPCASSTRAGSRACRPSKAMATRMPRSTSPRSVPKPSMKWG
jgi:hypothetical protein